MPDCLLYTGNVPEGWVCKAGSDQERGEVDWGPESVVDGGGRVGARFEATVVRNLAPAQASRDRVWHECRNFHEDAALEARSWARTLVCPDLVSRCGATPPDPIGGFAGPMGGSANPP